LTAIDPHAGSGLPAGQLYDAQRRVYYAKPVLRGWLHLLWFGASLVAGPLLVARGRGAWPITALAVYAVSMSGLFGISALYHRGTWGPRWSMRLQRMDHMMIFFLIAGTATPVFLMAVRGRYGLTCLIVMWALTLADQRPRGSITGAAIPLSCYLVTSRAVRVGRRTARR